MFKKKTRQETVEQDIKKLAKRYGWKNYLIVAETENPPSFLIGAPSATQGFLSYAVIKITDMILNNASKP